MSWGFFPPLRGINNRYYIINFSPITRMANALALLLLTSNENHFLKLSIKLI